MPWWSMAIAFLVGYCWGRAGEIGARMKAWRRYVKAYGKYPDSY
jgi:hypothetical protein